MAQQMCTIICLMVCSGTLDIALRLPDGNRLMRRFRASERIHDVLNFLRWKGVHVQGLVLTAQFPRKVSALTAPSSYPGVRGLSVE